MKRALLLILLSIFTFSPIAPAEADGLLYIDGVYRQPKSSHINVIIDQKVATTSLEQVFSNPLNKQVSAVYVAPVPKGATITSFAQLIDGQWVEAEIKSSEVAKAEFEAAASEGKDAAITSASVSVAPGADPETTFQTKLVLPAQSQRAVRLTYTEVLTGEVGLTRYTYPLSSTNLTDEPVGDLLVNIEIVEQDEIRSVYSPSHTVETSRAETNKAVVLYRAQNVTPSTDFELVYTQSSDQFGLNLASYRAKDSEDGYFMLIAAPQVNSEKAEVIEKDFVFVLDRSGSMQGAKFKQAKAALVHILDALNEGDRFTVVAFDSEVTAFSDELLPLSERDRAKTWVTNLEIAGGTNINDSLLRGLKTVDRTSERPHIVVFLTDGQATAGVTITSEILNNVRRKIQPQSRIYTIGIGDVNQPLLESLAQENRGTALLLTATQPIEAPLKDFYAAIDSPVLVDLALDFGGVEVYDIHPYPIPDMFLGGQIVVTGRYKGSGIATVTLTGRINGEKHVSTYEGIKFIETAAEGQKNSFVPRLWAQRKIDALVRTISINGPDPKLIEEVTALGLEYKLVTPYTSFIVTDKSEPTPAALYGAPATGLPSTGLAFLYVDDYRTMNTILMIGGGMLALIGVAGLLLARKKHHV